METFQHRFNTVTASVQGSGWGWLAYHKKTNRLKLKVTLNQDQLSDHSIYYVPLIGIDAWEHAYYLDYKNARPTYLNEMWKIINWQKVAERLDAAIIESGNKPLYWRIYLTQTSGSENTLWLRVELTFSKTEKQQKNTALNFLPQLRDYQWTSSKCK